MKEKRVPTTKPKNKSLTQETSKPKVEKKKKPTKAQTKALENNPTSTVEHPPTIEEIEAIKEDILSQGLMNPYALILYQYMCKSSYEINLHLVLSMRETLLKITNINQLILDELNKDQEG